MDDVAAALNRNDVPAAIAAADSLGGLHSRDPNVLAARAEAAFYDGDYPDAYDALKKAVDAGYQDSSDELALYERTMFASAGWVEETRGRFTVRWRPGLDAMLVDQAFQTLEAANSAEVPLLGEPPPGRTILEIYPDGTSFIAASSLTKEDVYTTGVVALSKWSRLLLTSPRAQARGYDWRGTIAHEYVHLIVAHQTNGLAPVWLQEAIARYLDNRWVDGTDHFQVDARSRGLVADALAKDDLVTFQEMNPSFAKLPTADRAALAYAQVSTLMSFCFQQGGEGVLLAALPAIRDGADPAQALANAAGRPNFSTLEQDWKQWMLSQGYQSRHIAQLPTVLDGGDEAALDPVLSERADLARFESIGTVYLQKARTSKDQAQSELYRKAALVEFAKAIPEGEPPSPLLANRLAEAHLGMGERDVALQLLTRSAADYPEFTATQKLLGDVYRAANDEERALEAYEAAANLDPFDAAVQHALVDLYDEAGNVAARDEHQALLDLRGRGGGGYELTPIHTRSGEYALPTAAIDEASAMEAVTHALVGKKAPPLDVTTLDGHAIDAAAVAGKVLVIDFWATWCGPCVASMPHLDALAKAHPGDMVVVGVSDEPAAKVKAFLAKNPVSYSIVAGKTPEALGLAADALPTLYVVGRDGRVVDVVVGADLGRVEKAVGEALAPPEP
jgi:thiol-disulfide isomerase/thioredoxin